MVNNWLKTIQSLLLPLSCAVCGASPLENRSIALCAACHHDLPRIPRPCPRCGLPLPDGTPRHQSCGRCQRHPPRFDRCIAPFEYAPPISRLIAGLKYGHKLAHAPLLAELLVAHLTQTSAPRPDILLPVPLHTTRTRERGFNQAVEFGRVLSRRLAIPLDRRSLQRIHATPSQASLDRKARKKNIRGAFAWRYRVDGQNVAIIDDVVTTGATCEEIARVLKQAGAIEVSVWAVARTPD